MARKKKKNDVQAETAASNQEPIQVVSGEAANVEEEFIPPTLTSEELYKLRAFEAESKSLILEARILLAERNDFLRKVDPEGKLAKWGEEIERRKEGARSKKISYSNTIQQIEKRLKISMADYSFDDETGTLIYMK